MFRRFMCLAMLGGLVTAFGVFGGAAASSAGTDPTGQVMYGNTTFVPSPTSPNPPGHFAGGGGTIEPAYNATTGTPIYLQTPVNAHVNPNDHNVALLYIPVYPIHPGFTATLNCLHVPADNCPDHGPAVAAAAESAFPDVYGQVGDNGVLGHDHLAGIASSGGDFNVLWEPTLVLFTSLKAVHDVGHITTLAQITAATAGSNPEAVLVKLPQLDFHCSVVSAAAYARGTPSPTVVGP